MFSFARTAATAACVVGYVAADYSAATKNIVQLAESVPDLSILVELVAAGGLVDTLSGAGPFTVFAPTNEAFEALGNATIQHLLDPANKKELDTILTYHVVSGDVHSKDLTDGEVVPTVEGEDVTVHIKGKDVFINDAQVVEADVDASNGVVHVVSKVLLPPRPAPKNIVQLAESVPDLSILVELVVAGGLVDTLSGTGPFTVFAPTNEAFEALGNATLQKLLEPSQKAELVKILTYHVASGDVHAKDLSDGESIPTVEGEDITVHIKGQNVFINDAQVVKADVDASNGVVHVVNAVLIPK